MHLKSDAKEKTSGMALAKYPLGMTLLKARQAFTEHESFRREPQLRFNMAGKRKKSSLLLRGKPTDHGRIHQNEIWPRQKW